MNINQLRYVSEVEKTGSISKAAKSLFMGQPNLSKAIKELESEIGITIFKRTRQGVEPTEMGARFLSYARTIISQMDELESLYKPNNKKEIRFNVSVPRATYISIAFTDFINVIDKNLPFEIRFKETSGMGAISDVARKESDLAIVRYKSDCEEYYTNFIKSMKLEFEPLWEYKMKILMNKNHPLSKVDVIPYHMVGEYTEIMHGDVQEGKTLEFSQINRDVTLNGERKIIYVYERGSQFDLLRNVNGTYMWVSPMPQDVLDKYDLVQKDCSLASPINKDIIVYSNKYKKNEYEEKFLDCVKKCINSVKP